MNELDERRCGWRVLVFPTALALSGFLGCTPAPFEVSGTMLEATNEARRMGGGICRAAPGAEPLSRNDDLMVAALVQARDLESGLGTRALAGGADPHIGSDGSSVGERAADAGYEGRSIRENVYYQTGATADADAVAGWMDSPGHCANLTARDIAEVGWARGEADGGVWVVSVYGMM